MTRERRIYLRWLLVALLWLVAFVQFPAVGFYSRSILQYFAGGYSEFKPLFGIFWICLCLLLLTLSPHSQKPFRAALTIVPVVIAHVSSLSIHLLYCAVERLPVLAFTLSATDREISSNQLLHIHVSKGLLFGALKLLGLERIQQTSDPGRIYFEVLPTWIFVLHALLVLLAATAVLRSLPRLADRWREQGRGFLLPTYIISTSAVIRCAVDGGPLDWTNLVLFPIFVLLLMRKEVSLRSLVLRLLGFEACALLFTYVLHRIAHTEAPLGVVYNGFLSLFFVVAVTLVAASVKTKKLQFAALGAVVVFVWASTNTFWAWDFRAWRAMLPFGTLLYVEDFYDRYPQLPGRFSEGRLSVRLLEVQEDTRLSSVFAKLGIRMGFSSVVDVTHSCNPSENFQRQGLVRVLSGKFEDRVFPQSLFAEFELAPVALSDGTEYRYRAVFHGCVPDSGAEAIVNRLYEVGLRRIVLIPE